MNEGRSNGKFEPTCGLHKMQFSKVGSIHLYIIQIIRSRLTEATYGKHPYVASVMLSRDARDCRVFVEIRTSEHTDYGCSQVVWR
jgi:ribosome-binding factor A